MRPFRIIAPLLDQSRLIRRRRRSPSSRGRETFEQRPLHMFGPIMVIFFKDGKVVDQVIGGIPPRSSRRKDRSRCLRLERSPEP